MLAEAVHRHCQRRPIDVLEFLAQRQALAICRLGVYVLAAHRQDGRQIEQTARDGAVLVTVRLLANREALPQQPLRIVEMALMLSHEAEVVLEAGDETAVRSVDL